MGKGKKRSTINIQQNSNELKSGKNLVDILTNGSVPYIIISVLIGLIYFQSISFDFSGLDDKDYLIPRAASIGGIANIDKIIMRDAFFKEKGTEFYRPVQNLSLVLDTEISKTAPWGFHLSNIIIHILCSISLLYLFNTLKIEKLLGFFFTLLFAVHPLFVHAVAWIPSRGDLLMCLFGILSFTYFIRYISLYEIKYLILHICTLLFAIFSKESAIGIPVLFILWFLFNEKRKPRELFTGINVIMIISWLLIPIIYFIMRSIVMVSAPADNIFGIKPFLSNLATIPEFISKFILPIKLSPMPKFDFLTTILGLVLIGIIGLLFLSNKMDKKFYIFSIGWFLLYSLPSMFYRHETANTAYDYFEHRAYLPIIGILLIFVYLLNKVLSKKDYPKLMIVFIPLILVFSLYSYLHAQNYKDPLAFYNKSISASNQVALAYMNRGKIMHDAGNKNAALADYEQAIKLNPNYAIAYNNRGLIRDALGNKQGALDDYTKALMLKPGFSEAYSNRGNIKSDLSDYDGALKDLDSAIKYNQESFKAYNSRGVIKGMRKQWQEALSDINKALAINPKYNEAYANRGNVRHALGDQAGACADWNILAATGDKYSQKMIERFCK